LKSKGWHQNGFTLIELSIVLVIVGLLAAGILVGRDLIHAAEMRQQISQIEKFNTAIRAFQTKYGALPGDLKADDAVALGFTTRSGTAGHGDGNGVLERCAPLYNPPYADPILGCEDVLFWSDLSKAQLIEGQFDAAIDGGVFDFQFTTFEESLKYFPRAKIVSDAAVFASTGPDYRGGFAILKLTLSNAGGSASLYDEGRIHPADGFIMDTKMDDGNPLGGTVTVNAFGAPGPGHFYNPPWTWASYPYGNGPCVTEDGLYNVNISRPEDGSRALCQMNFRWQ